MRVGKQGPKMNVKSNNSEFLNDTERKENNQVQAFAVFELPQENV